MATRAQNIVGHKFSRLTVIAQSIDLRYGKRRLSCECLCECGNRRTVLAVSLRAGATKSCGCLNREVVESRAHLNFEGRKHADESKALMRDAHLGKTQSPEAILKTTEANRGSRRSEESRAKMSAAQKKRKGTATPETRAKISASKTGKPCRCTKKKVQSPEARRRRSISALANREKCPFYIDGKGHERHDQRLAELNRVEYKLWREAVFRRDNFTCQLCGATGTYVQADHIERWADRPDLRYEIDNGRTLCRPCHRKTPTYGRKSTAKPQRPE